MTDAKIALVLGGAGNIGSATVAAFLELDDMKNVIITSRSQEKIDKAIENVTAIVGQRADKILGFVGELTSDEEAEALQKKVRDAVGDKIDFVVSAMGFSFMQTDTLLQVSTDKLRTVLDSQLFSAFGGYKAFMPFVQNSLVGSYVFISGGGPDNYIGPGTGTMTISSSANTALAKICMKEQATDSVVIAEISIRTLVVPEPDKLPPSPLPSTSSLSVGRALVGVATKRKADGKTMLVQSEADAHRLATDGIL